MKAPQTNMKLHLTEAELNMSLEELAKLAEKEANDENSRA